MLKKGKKKKKKKVKVGIKMGGKFNFKRLGI